MATSTISNTVTDPSGVAVSGAVINARLKPNGVGYRVSDGTEVATLVSTISNASGFWSLALERNSNITPSGSYYEIEERISDAAGGSRNWAISVGTVSTTVYAALTVPPAPTGAAIYYLTQTAADARYQALGSYGSGNQIVGTSTIAGVATSALRSDAQFALSSAIAGAGLALTNGAIAPASGYNFYRTSTYAGLPLASAVSAGTIYMVTDSFHLIMSDATNWHYLDDRPGTISWASRTAAADTGEVLCYGQTLTGAQTSYPWLWAVIDTAFKSGSNIVLPDLRGRTPTGLDNMGGSDAGRLDLGNTMGTTFGEQYHTLALGEMPSHAHGPGGDASAFLTDGSGAGSNITTGGGSYATRVATASQGSGTAHNNMQPGILLNGFMRL